MTPCPNCRALNPPGTIICDSCGINVVPFAEAQSQINKIRDDHAAKHEAELQEDAREYIAEESDRIQVQLRKNLKLTVVIAVVLAIGVVLFAAYNAYIEQQRRLRLAADYELAAACLEEAYFLCARDGFDALLAEEPGYPNAERQLIEARLGLAQSLNEAERWEEAKVELNLVLEAEPFNKQARALLSQNYADSIANAKARGNIVEAWRLLMERSAHPAKP
jgi:Tfp pilus assembly protein PilE